jgi:IclR family transcriptional regulator, acetate operon repressor
MSIIAKLPAKPRHKKGLLLQDHAEKTTRQPTPGSHSAPPAAKSSSLSALDKATLVLEAIVAYPRPIGLPDLTADLGLPRQTIHRILQQLCDNGLIIRDPSRDRYAVGPRLSKLAMKTLDSDNYRAPLRAILTDVVEDVEETCNFGVLDGLEFMYLDRLECSWSLRVHLTAGSRVPAYCTSGGKALLAHLDRPLRNALIRSRKLEAHTETTIVDPGELERELDEILTQGYALNNEEHTVGVVGAAVPILSGDGRALGALALHGPSQRLTLADAKKHVPRLRAAAIQLATVWSRSED